MEAALAAQASVWGGFGNLVIPWTPDLLKNDLFWAIVERFDPDSFAVFNPTYAEVADFDPAWHKDFMDREYKKREREHDAEIAEVHIRQIADFEVINLRVEPGSFDALLALAPFQAHGGGSVPVRNISAKSAVQGPALRVAELVELPKSLINRHAGGRVAQLLLTASLGRLAAPTIQELRDRDVLVSSQTAPMRQLEWAQAVMKGPQPGAQHAWLPSEIGLAQYRALLEPSVSALVVGDTAWDFALYYALKRMSGQAWWLPSWLRRNQSYMWRLHYELEYGPGRMGRTLAVVGASDKNRGDLSKFLVSMEGKPFDFRFANFDEVLPDHPVRIYEEDNHGGRGESLELVDGRTLRLDTPIPARAHTSPEWQMKWVTEVHARGWSAIRHPVLATELLQGTLYQADQVRVTSTGVAYTCPNAIIMGGEDLATAVVRPELVPLPLLDQLQRIAEASGWRVVRSDKGAYATESARLLGGSDHLVNSLRDPTRRSIFNTYLEREGVPGKWLRHDSRRYLSWGSFVELIGEDATRREIPVLLEQGVLERGLILKCVRCRQQAWYHLERVDDSFRCNRCRVSQPVEGQWDGTNEPVWYYRLAEVVYQLLGANGDVPLLAVADAFSESQNLLQSYELEVFPPDAENGQEFDIFVAEGSRLWIGEANITGDFKAKRLKQLLGVATEFDAYGVMLATTECDFTPSTRTAIEKVLSWRSRPRLKLLTDVKRVP